MLRVRLCHLPRGFRHLKAGVTASLALSALMLVGACSPVGMAIGAGATVVNTASEERGLDGAGLDTLIDARIRDALTDEGHGLLSDIGVTVRERRVLLTGRVQTEQDHQTILQTVKAVEDVGEILDAVSVGETEDLAGAARDRLIAEDLNSDLLFDSVIKSVNYAPVVSHRIVYLMGVAQSPDELDRVIAYARNIAYVRGVVSLVMLRDDPRRLAPSESVQQIAITPVRYRPGAAVNGAVRVSTAIPGPSAGAGILPNGGTPQ